MSYNIPDLEMEVDEDITDARLQAFMVTHLHAMAKTLPINVDSELIGRAIKSIKKVDIADNPNRKKIIISGSIFLDIVNKTE